MDRMPPASARYTHARTCDHTNPHPRAWLVKNVWVARTRGGKREREREVSRGRGEGKLGRRRRKKNLGKSKKKRTKRRKKEEG